MKLIKDSFKITFDETTNALYSTINPSNLCIVTGVPSFDLSKNSKKFGQAIGLISSYISNSKVGKVPNALAVFGRVLLIIEELFSKDTPSFFNAMKGHSNWLKQWVITGTHERLDVPISMWDSSTHCPYMLEGLIDLLRSLGKDTDEYRDVLRVGLTILDIPRVMTYPTRPNVDTIIKPLQPGCEKFSFDYLECLKRLGVSRELFITILQEMVKNHKPHITTARGPNGSAIWIAHHDAKAVIRDLFLFQRLGKFADLLGLDGWLKRLDSAGILPTIVGRNLDHPEHSKLHVIYEKGNKARIIAIVDYWTQDIITPLHNALFKILSSIPQDYTINQDAGFDAVKELTKSSDNGIYSMDLSAATDRLPVLFQTKILRTLTDNPELADVWESLMTERSFKAPSGDRVKYMVGQPMGIRTSFAILALFHHIIVQQAAINAGVNNYSDYAILGDDIVLTNKAVADHYKQIITGIGIEISVTKSLVTQPKSKYRVAEFCRRLAINGIEYSALPIGLMVRAHENNLYAPELQSELIRRDLIESADQLFSFMASFLNKVEYQQLVRLNCLPLEISGLRGSFTEPQAPSLNLANLMKELEITEDELLNLWSYLLICEQLSKLDSILKSTISVSEVLLTSVGMAKGSGLRFEATELYSDDDIRHEVGILLRVGSDHPVIEAVQAEVARISELLIQFTTSSTDLRSLLRRSVVESLRTSITDTFENNLSRPSRITRMITNKFFKVIIGLRTSAITLPLRHTTKLTTIERLWTVMFNKGSNVYITNTRSQIGLFQSDISNRRDNYTSNLTLFNDVPSDSP